MTTLHKLRASWAFLVVLFREAAAVPPAPSIADRLGTLRAKLAARTNPDGTAKLGYRLNVEHLRREISSLEAADAAPAKPSAPASPASTAQPPTAPSRPPSVTPSGAPPSPVFQLPSDPAEEAALAALDEPSDAA